MAFGLHLSSFSGDGVAGAVANLIVDNVDKFYDEYTARQVPIDTPPVDQTLGQPRDVCERCGRELSAVYSLNDREQGNRELERPRGSRDSLWRLLLWAAVQKISARLRWLRRNCGASRLRLDGGQDHWPRLRHRFNREGPIVRSETVAGQATDTARYLAAGARRALLVTRCGPEVPIDEIRLELGEDCNVLFESNRIIDVVKPDVCLALVGGSGTELKPSFLRLLQKADALVSLGAIEMESTGSGGDIPCFELRDACSPDAGVGEVAEGAARSISPAGFEGLTYLPGLSAGKGSVLSEPSRCLMSICTLPSAASSSCLQAAERPTPSSKSLSESSRAQVALFELIDDGFELLERFFKGGHGGYSVSDCCLVLGRTLAMTSAATV